MWDFRYSNDFGHCDDNFALSKTPEEDTISRSSTYLISLTNKVSQPFNSVYDVKDETGISDGFDFEISDDANDTGNTDAYSWINVENSGKLPVVKSAPVSSSVYMVCPGTPSLTDSQLHPRETVKEANKNNIDTEGEKMRKVLDTNLLYGYHPSIFLACFVRMMLISHNILAVWRVTYVYNENLYWLLVTTNFLLIFECMIVVIRNGGKENSWWCPCFLIYLASTIPAIWLLQLNQYDAFVNEEKAWNGTSDIDVWVIVIEQSFIYLLVFSRWLMPPGKVSRDLLADLFIDFLAVAADIMEFLAVFDEDKIRGSFSLTIAIMVVWSASFAQFVPVFMQRKILRKPNSSNVECITQCCGDKRVEILATCLGIFLQDMPFLVVRLYIIIRMKIITYSLIFFLIKNIVALMLACYSLLSSISLKRKT